MKLIRAEVSNFGSYKDLALDFDSQGLTLVAGATGSGKSTLCDIVPWVLFGCTAKDGAVDEVCSWNGTGETSGTLKLQTKNERIEIVRTRKPNDLYYVVNGSIRRGKDINDTQKLIEDRLGITKKAYISAFYYHEISETAAFFTTKAKERRALTETFADLTLAKSLTENLSDYRKVVKREREALVTNITVKDAEIKQLNELLMRETAKAKAWETKHKLVLADMEEEATQFEAKKFATIEQLKQKSKEWNLANAEKLCALDNEVAVLEGRVSLVSSTGDAKAALQQQIESCSKEVCEVCGSAKGNERKAQYVANLHVLEKQELKQEQLKQSLRGAKLAYRTASLVTNPYAPQIPIEETRTNVYSAQLLNATAETNPHTGTIKDLTTNLEKLNTDRTEIQKDIDVLSLENADVDLLLDITGEFRALQVKNTITELERSTNNLLSEHFDAELRVQFDIQTADKLEVLITKDGNTCTFTQLSKGQRCLLKLCFGVSVMQTVANHHGVDFNTIFFDESLDGLDETLKLRAFGLFSKLATQYENVFVVEHNEALKTCFTKQYQVNLVDGWSELEKT